MISCSGLLRLRLGQLELALQRRCLVVVALGRLGGELIVPLDHDIVLAPKAFRLFSCVGETLCCILLGRFQLLVFQEYRGLRLFLMSRINGL